MSKATIQERGQVTIPKKIRDRLGLKPGSVLDFREETGRLVAEKVESGDPIDAIYGLAGSGRRTQDVLKSLRDDL